MPSPRHGLLLLLLVALAGCDTFDDNRRQRETDRIAREDSERRQARLRAQGTLNPQEYESLSNKMGWSRTDARGLPIPPTTEELEKRVKASEAAR